MKEWRIERQTERVRIGKEETDNKRKGKDKKKIEGKIEKTERERDRY